MKFGWIVVVFVVASCSQKDPKMCVCLEAGEKLNSYNSQILMQEKTPEKVSKLRALKKEKEQKCVDFQTMSGEEMLKKKEGCE